MTVVLSFPKERKQLNWYANLRTFYIVSITIENKSSENKTTFQEYRTTFPYMEMPHFLDWLCTIREVCALIFDIKLLKNMLQKNGID